MGSQTKSSAASVAVAAVVIAVGSSYRTVPEIKKWSDLKNVIPREGTPELSSLETQMASLLGETSVCVIVLEKQGDTDMAETTDEPCKALLDLFVAWLCKQLNLETCEDTQWDNVSLCPLVPPWSMGAVAGKESPFEGAVAIPSTSAPLEVATS